MMKASHRLMHTQATSAPEKKSIMQAPTKRGSRSVSNEGGMAEAVLLCCKTGGGGEATVQEAAQPRSWSSRKADFHGRV